jgi:hypothetical protein
LNIKAGYLSSVGMAGVVFVTAFLDLGEDRSQNKSVDVCFNHFNSLAKTGVNIQLFLSFSYMEAYNRICKHHTNVLVEYVELSQLDTFRMIADLVPHLPSSRTEYKDTRAFLTLMNAKAELLHRAMGPEPGYCSSSRRHSWGASHFAWIDFSIFHVIRDTEATITYITELSKKEFPHERCMLVPGCWEAGRNADSLFNAINWRFCGGFMLASVDAIVELNALYYKHFRSTVAERGLTWEVNFWSLLENEYGWRPQWYKADHNDSIVRVPF